MTERLTDEALEGHIEALLDAQQDINLAANETMSQPLCDASALLDVTEGLLRELLAHRRAAPADDLRAAGRVKVPQGQTPLNDKLGHRLLDVFNEGMGARDAGTGSPYHGHSLEHCIHAAGWVQRDLRLALDEARAALSQRAPAPQHADDLRVEVAAWAMWKEEAAEGAPKSIYAARTIEAFRGGLNPCDQERWIRKGRAVVAALSQNGGDA